jgi:hypothetical protein
MSSFGKFGSDFWPQKQKARLQGRAFFYSLIPVWQVEREIVTWLGSLFSEPNQAVSEKRGSQGA